MMVSCFWSWDWTQCCYRYLDWKLLFIHKFQLTTINHSIYFWKYPLISKKDYWILLDRFPLPSLTVVSVVVFPYWSVFELIVVLIPFTILVLVEELIPPPNVEEDEDENVCWKLATLPFDVFELLINIPPKGLWINPEFCIWWKFEFFFF